jgi:tetratricopeptide (TPR) repeat protein
LIVDSWALSAQPPTNDLRATVEANRDLVRVLAIVALTCLSYLPVRQAGFVWDDKQHVMYTPQQVSLRGLRDLWLRPGFQPQYYPLTHTSFWIEYHLWGTDGSGHPRATGYHVVNVLLHAINALLVWRILRRLDFDGAFIVGVLFAIHPVCVESVAWISERKNTLSTLFYLFAALSYFRFDAQQELDGTTGRRWGMYALGTLLFICALLSKSVTCSLPAALLLVIWWKRGRIELRRDVLPLVPWFVLGAILGLHTAAKERFGVGASGAEWNLSPIDRVLVAGRALWFYAGKLAFPWPLAFNYPRWKIDAREPWQYVLPAAAAVVIALLWVLRNRLGRGPLVAVLFFAGTLAPALGFFNLYPMRFSFVADHMQYLACIGLLSLAAAGFCRIRNASVRRAVIVPIVAVLCALTYWQAGAYESPQMLWRDTLAKYPDEWMPNMNLGVELAHEGKLDEAIGHINKSLQLKADQPEANLAMGDVLLQAGRADEALKYYERAGEVAPRNFRAPYAIARLYTSRGQIDRAIAEYRRTIELEPRFVTVRVELADFEAAAHRYDAAADVLRPAIELDPDDVALQNKLAVLLLRGGRATDAADLLRKTVQHFPDNAEAHANLGAALETLGDRDAALREYREAARLKPELVPAQQGVRRLENGR